MSYQEIIRAWKDEVYRLSLSEEQRAQLPENPAGLIELTDTELDGVAGATSTHYCDPNYSTKPRDGCWTDPGYGNCYLK